MLDFKDEVWITAEGKEIMVRNMSEEHAKNCLRVLIRRARKSYHKDIIEYLEDIENIFFDQQL